jgi:beta-glucosidase/6-phospho-beta-glucosidase/beta-galactosidase
VSRGGKEDCVRFRSKGHETALWLILAACCISCSSTEPYGFPGNFLFGTASSSFQIDMGCPTLPPGRCTDPNSDWYQFATSPETIESGLTYLSGEDPAEVGPGHWELYPGDFDLVADELSNNAFRMNIEWSRIFDAPTDEIRGFESLRAAANQYALEHYHQVFAALRQRGLKPMVTLNHYTLPVWIHDAVGCHLSLGSCTERGWLDSDRLLREITKFSSFVAKEFGGEVDLWSTVHNSVTIWLTGYLLPTSTKVNPPAVWLQVAEAKAVYAALIEAHARMYDAVKENDLVDADGDGVNAMVGITFPMSPTRPQNPDEHYDRQGAENVFYLWNSVWLNAYVLGEFDRDMDGNAEFVEELAGRMDYLGLNYSLVIYIKGTRYPTFPEISPLSTFDPLVQDSREEPQGLYEMLMHLNETYGLPVIISESGVDDRHDDGRAPEYIVQHLVQVQQAMDDGVDVRGFMYGNLLDGFSWQNGTTFKYGLYAVDPTDPARNRRARQGAATYATIASQRDIPEELIFSYPLD